MRPGRIAASLALATAVLGACDSSAESDTTTTVTTTTIAATTTTTTQPPTTTTSSTTTTTTLPPIDWVFTDESSLPVVTVLDPGEEPRRVLEYELDVGATATTVVRQLTGIEQSIDGDALPGTGTDVSIELAAEVLDVDELGATIQQTFGQHVIHDADPATASILHATYDDLAGRSVYVLVAPSGANLATSTSDLPPELAGFAQQAGSATPPFPSEPVGVGASWQVDTSVAVVGFAYTQTTTVELVDLTDTTATVEVTITQDLGPDGFAVPGIETEDVTYDTTGSGNAIWTLNSPLGGEGSVSITSTLEATLSNGDEQADFRQVTRNVTTTGPGPLPNLDLSIEGASLPPVPLDDSEADPAVGLVAPMIDGHAYDGTPVQIDPADGKRKAIVLVAHWCPHCQEEIPRVQAWLDDTGGVDGVDVYSVSTAAESTQPNYPPEVWLETEGWTVPVVVDDVEGSVVQAYGAYGGYPTWVFLNRDGTVALRLTGELGITQLQSIMEGLP